jgi:hypothetical protein
MLKAVSSLVPVPFLPLHRPLPSWFLRRWPRQRPRQVPHMSAGVSHTPPCDEAISPAGVRASGVAAHVPMPEQTCQPMTSIAVTALPAVSP